MWRGKCNPFMESSGKMTTSHDDNELAPLVVDLDKYIKNTKALGEACFEAADQIWIIKDENRLWSTFDLIEKIAKELAVYPPPVHTPYECNISWVYPFMMDRPDRTHRDIDEDPLDTPQFSAMEVSDNCVLRLQKWVEKLNLGPPVRSSSNDIVFFVPIQECRDPRSAPGAILDESLSIVAEHDDLMLRDGTNACEFVRLHERWKKGYEYSKKLGFAEFLRKRCPEVLTEQPTAGSERRATAANAGITPTEAVSHDPEEQTTGTFWTTKDDKLHFSTRTNGKKDGEVVFNTEAKNGKLFWMLCGSVTKREIYVSQAIREIYLNSIKNAPANLNSLVSDIRKKLEKEGIPGSVIHVPTPYKTWNSETKIVLRLHSLRNYDELHKKSKDHKLARECVENVDACRDLAQGGKEAEQDTEHFPIETI